MEYTPRVDGFQIRDVTYIPGCQPRCTIPEYDIVKWEQHEPYEVIDMKTGEKKMCSESCYSVGRLVYDLHEPGFVFKSIGTRWLECNPTQNFLDVLRNFYETKSEELHDRVEELKDGCSWIVYADYAICPICGNQTSHTYKHCPGCGRRVYSRW